MKWMDRLRNYLINKGYRPRKRPLPPEEVKRREEQAETGLKMLQDDPWFRRVVLASYLEQEGRLTSDQAFVYNLKWLMRRQRRETEK